MVLPFRSLFVALFFVIIPLFITKLTAEPYRSSQSTTYYGDANRRPLDGSYRNDVGWRSNSSEDDRGSGVPSQWALRYDGVPLLAPIWSGLYLGAHGGGGWGSIETSLGDLDMSGAVLGTHIGYLIRSGPLVAGIELDADLSQINYAANIGNVATATIDVDWALSARARLGVLTGPALFYATGGIAMVGLSGQAGVSGGHFQSSTTQTGFVAGGGVEIGLNEKIALRIEALHYFMPEQKMALPLGAGSLDVDGSFTTVRAGLTFFLN